MKHPAWQSAHDVMEILEQHGHEAVIVGGAVRDYLLDKPANDVDVATSAMPLEVKALFEKTVDVGIAHGTILVLGFEEPIEVTTFRTEGTYTDRRRPDEVTFVRSLAEDLKRRDFTINAMALRRSGELVDLYQGQEDLQKKIIRAVGEPYARFSEDALRIIRGVRFVAQLGFTLEQETLIAMQKTSHYLGEIAIERVKAEWDKIFVSRATERAMYYMQEYNLGEAIPGTFESYSKWQNYAAKDAKWGWTYWCILTNDFTLLQQYRCSNDEKSFVKQAKACYDILFQHRPTKFELFQYDLKYWECACELLALQNVTKVISYPELVKEKQDLPIQHVQEIAVTGKHLMTWMNQKGGPWLREVLDEIVKRVVNGQLENNEQTIKEWLQNEWFV